MRMLACWDVPVGGVGGRWCGGEAVAFCSFCAGRKRKITGKREQGAAPRSLSAMPARYGSLPQTGVRTFVARRTYCIYAFTKCIGVGTT